MQEGDALLQASRSYHTKVSQEYAAFAWRQHAFAVENSEEPLPTNTPSQFTQAKVLHEFRCVM